MIIDPSTLAPHEFYKHLACSITPRPIAWVSTISPGSVTNLAPFSFFNGVGANPPSVVFSPVNNRQGDPKDTLINVQATGEFVVNLVSQDLAKCMNETAYEYGYEVSEFAKAGLTEVASERVGPPRVDESPVSMECRVIQIVPVGEGPLAANLVIGEVLLMHLNDGIMDANGCIDPAKIDTVGRLGTSDYCTTRDRFAMPRPTKPRLETP